MLTTKAWQSIIIPNAKSRKQTSNAIMAQNTNTVFGRREGKEREMNRGMEEKGVFGCRKERKKNDFFFCLMLFTYML